MIQRSVANDLGKMHPSYREAVVKKLTALGDLPKPSLMEAIPENPTIEQALMLLGYSTYRLEALKDIESTIQKGMCYSYITPQYTETTNLIKCCREMAKLSTDLIRAILHKETLPCTPPA